MLGELVAQILNPNGLILLWCVLSIRVPPGGIHLIHDARRQRRGTRPDLEAKIQFAVVKCAAQNEARAKRLVTHVSAISIPQALSGQGRKCAKELSRRRAYRRYASTRLACLERREAR